MVMVKRPAGFIIRWDALFYGQRLGKMAAVGLARLLLNYCTSFCKTRPQFARYYLMQLGIGNELKRVALNPEFPYRLASVEEVLAIRPELLPPE